MGSIEYIKEEIPGGNIVTRIFNGEISKDEILSSFQYMLDENKLDHNSIALITVISNSTIVMDLSDVENMVNFMSSNEMLSKIKIAVVSDDSDKIILPTLVHFKIGEKLRPFGSIKEAKEWIIDNNIHYL